MLKKLLFSSREWSGALEEANELARTYGNSKRPKIFVGINRSPCKECSDEQVTVAIQDAYARYPYLKTFADFTLIVKGLYEGKKGTNATTEKEMVDILRSGWEINVLKGPIGLKVSKAKQMEGQVKESAKLTLAGTKAAEMLPHAVEVEVQTLTKKVAEEIKKERR